MAIIQAGIQALIPPDFIWPEMVEDVSPGLKRLTFPGGFFCYTTSGPDEAALIYNEIMVRQEYFRSGLSLEGAGCVFDVGANIGIFTLAVKQLAPNATVVAFEPIPETYAALERNVRSHDHPDVHLYNAAAGSQDRGEMVFTYFPNMPGNSTAQPELKQQQLPAFEQIFGKEQSDFLHQSVQRVVPVRTLSSVIQEQGITGIEYLKIDVEGEELAVLAGIDDAHWPMIRQVAIETHSASLQQKTCEILAGRGFVVLSDQGLSSPVGVSDVYARRG